MTGKLSTISFAYSEKTKVDGTKLWKTLKEEVPKRLHVMGYLDNIPIPKGLEEQEN